MGPVQRGSPLPFGSVAAGLEVVEQPRVDPHAHLQADARARSPLPVERTSWMGVHARVLASLVAVAEERSFGRAARRLGYSRSSVSHQIAQLEAAVGVSLVHRGRGGRSVSVTPAGEVVVAHGRAMLRLLESARLQVERVANAPP
jgi:molybdenum-dependent DNA-binding transcriptional regulator ModE